MGKRVFLTVLLCALLLMLSVPGLAQESSVKGNLGGVVLDPTGAVVPGAKVTLTGPTGSTSVESDAEGKFMFPLLPPGAYSVRVERQGFKAAEAKAVGVEVGRTASVRVQLETGIATQVVEVSADAVTVDVSTTASGSNLSDTFYSKVPTPRNIAGLFYVAPGVADSGGAGRANPSISGGSGLENLYIADGVNVTDSAFGGLGVFTRNQGSVGTGINLSFIKEVQVKTGGFEPQYGQATGGVVQIVTKSGGRDFHGAIAGYLAPRSLVAGRSQPDDVRFANSGILDNSANYDISGELGGYVPGFREHLFFFGAFNPTWNFVYATPPRFDLDGPAGGATPSPIGLFSVRGNNPFVMRTFVKSYAGKLTWKMNDRHALETSLFGDPSRNNQGPENLFLAVQNDGGFSKWDYGTRNWVVRYNATMSPTWLVNANFTWNNNRFKETPLKDDYLVTDISGAAPVQLQGFGFKEDHKSNGFAYTVDTSKSLHFIKGEHTFLLGFNDQMLNYDNTKQRSGARFAPPVNNMSGAPVVYSTCPGAVCPANAGTTMDASFNLVAAPGCTACPSFNGQPVALNVSRGEFGGSFTPTEGLYYAGYANDSWAINKHFTASAGVRWEQYTMRGSAVGYTFTGNWAPRLGVIYDPWGDRKTKIYGNFGQYNYQMPLDAAIRSLSSELDLTGLLFAPGSTGGVVTQNSDGSIKVIPDAAHLLNGAVGGISSAPVVSAQAAGEAFAPGSKMQYENEWVVGFERDLGHGMVFSARYIDRRLKRVVEDMAGVSPEGAVGGILQTFVIGNPSKATDLFVNQTAPITQTAGASCPSGLVNFNSTANGPADANGNLIGGLSGKQLCFPLASGGVSPGAPGIDGSPDGFVDPVRNYQAVEIELNKGFSRGWLMRINYRYARLQGNYEGAFRNDNGQTDPSISSLFDFTAGSFNLLGDQFSIGPLNTDRRHVANGFFSYTFDRHRIKGLSMGTGLRLQGGTPINKLADHPVYQNSGEVPIGGRGALGRTDVSGQLDFHADYPWKVGERSTVRLVMDLFNVTNSKPALIVDQNRDLSGGAAGSNLDFLKAGSLISQSTLLTGYQEPFRARFALRWEF